MSVRPVRASILMLSLLAGAPATTLASSIPVDMVFEDIGLSGTGSVPLGEYWDFVETKLSLKQSTVAPSTLFGSINFDSVSDPDLGDVITGFGLSLTGTWFLDLTFSEVNAPPGFGDDLGSSFTVHASIDKPLVVTVDFNTTIEQWIGVTAYRQCGSSGWSIDPDGATINCDTDAPGPTTLQAAVAACQAGNCAPDEFLPASAFDGLMLDVQDDGVEYALGVDLNDNQHEDALTYFGSSLMLASLNDINTFDNLLEQVLAIGTTIDISGLIFRGDIADLVADPEFTITLNGPVTLAQPVPAPVSAALLALGLAGMATRRALRPGSL